VGCYRPDLPTFSITPTLFAPGVRGSIVGRGAFCFGRLGLLGPGSPQVASVTLIGTGEQLGSPASSYFNSSSASRFSRVFGPVLAKRSVGTWYDTERRGTMKWPCGLSRGSNSTIIVYGFEDPCLLTIWLRISQCYIGRGSLITPERWSEEPSSSMEFHRMVSSSNEAFCWPLTAVVGDGTGQRRLQWWLTGFGDLRATRSGGAKAGAKAGDGLEGVKGMRHEGLSVAVTCDTWDGLQVYVEVWPIKDKKDRTGVQYIVEGSFKTKSCETAKEKHDALAKFLKKGLAKNSADHGALQGGKLHAQGVKCCLNSYM